VLGKNESFGPKRMPREICASLAMNRDALKEDLYRLIVMWIEKQEELCILADGQIKVGKVADKQSAICSRIYHRHTNNLKEFKNSSFWVSKYLSFFLQVNYTSNNFFC
jgi:hypothetical protein